MPTSEINTCWGLVLCGLSLTPALHCHAAIATWEKHMLLKTEIRKKPLQKFPEVKTHWILCVHLVPDMKQVPSPSVTQPLEHSGMELRECSPTRSSVPILQLCHF